MSLRDTRRKLANKNYSLSNKNDKEDILDNDIVKKSNLDIVNRSKGGLEIENKKGDLENVIDDNDDEGDEESNSNDRDSSSNKYSSAPRLATVNRSKSGLEIENEKNGLENVNDDNNDEGDNSIDE